MNDVLYFRLLTGKVEKATKESAAFDLFYNGDKPLLVTDIPVAVPTGVRTAFDPRLVAIIKEKSGLALKGVEVKGGVIDADYRDEWKVICRKPLFDMHSGDYPTLKQFNILPEYQGQGEAFVIQPGMKIAQFILVHLPSVQLESLAEGQLSIKDEQREGGFGSTGA